MYQYTCNRLLISLIMRVQDMYRPYRYAHTCRSAPTASSVILQVPHDCYCSSYLPTAGDLITDSIVTKHSS